MRCLLFLLAIVSSSAFADPYTYTGQYLAPDIYFSSAASACNAIFDWRQSETPSYRYVNKGISGSWNSNRITCLGDRITTSNNQVVGTNVVLGNVYRSMCTAGIDQELEWPFGVKHPDTGEVPPSEAILPPWPVCMAGCMYQKKNPSSPTCHTFPEEDPSKVFCSWTATRTGEGCATSDEQEPPELPDCVGGYVPSPSGCVPETPPDPCEANPTGTGCPGDPCVQNPNGEGCPGGGDPGGGDPGGGDPGGGDPGGGDPGGGDPGGGDPGGGDPGGGDPGGGDPGGGDPGGGDPGGGDNTAGGWGCDQTLVCSGDPIACAQLRVQKEHKCNSESMMDYPSQSGDIADFLDDPKYQEEEGEVVDVSDFVKEGSRFLPSSCPAPLVQSLSGGRSIRIPYDPICQVADSLSYLFVALAWVFFAVYVGRSSGGE